VAVRAGPWGTPILEPEVLVTLARHPPATASELADVPGVGGALASRWGGPILEALRGRTSRPPEPAHRYHPEETLGTVSDTGPDSQQSPRSGHLLRWRACAAADLGVPPYLVLSDATMATLATLERGDAQALAALPGIGPRALAKHGAHLLRLIAAYPPDRYVGP
jgi:ribonuclease D